MKNKLYILGLVSLSLLTYSCSTDDESYDVQELKTKNFEIEPQSILKVKIIDSTAIKLSIDVMEDDGDPINPKPPRTN